MREDTRRRITTAPRPAAATAAATATHRLVRADDQLDVMIELVDAQVVGGVEVVPSGPSPAIRVRFGSQHVAERTFSAATPNVPIQPINHAAAGPSLVVAPFDAPFSFTVAGVLDVLAANPLAGQSSPGAPDDVTTALEIPTGLVLSPVTPTRLVATATPRTAGTTTEIWTATLQSATSDGPVALAAIHNLAPTDAGLTTRVPDASARDHIVANSTVVAPLAARRLQLTTAGAFADLGGEWDADLASYQHRIATGRDVRVEVVTLGYLLPFGHRAAITEVAERTMVDDRGGSPTGILQVRRFLNIVEPDVTTPRPFARDGGHGLPLVRLTASASESTPIALTAIEDTDGAVIDGAHDLRILGSGDDLLVTYRCVDRAGNDVSLALPATFLDDDAAHETGPDGAPARLREVTNRAGRRARREVDLGGQLVAFADPLTAGSATAKRSHRFRLAWEGPADGATTDDLAASRSPAVFGVLEWAEVVDDAVAAITGDVASTIGVTLHPRWLRHGNGAENFDLAFLLLDDAASSLIGADSAVGGVAQLEVVAEVFNQLAGVGPDLDDLADWDPERALGEASRIIGNILLSQIVERVTDAIPGLDIPGTSVEIGADGTVTSRFTFCPQLKDLPAAGFRTVEGQTRCCVHLTATASLADEVEAAFETEMRVENFLLEFPPTVSPPVVVVDFESVVATVSSDGSTSLVPTIREWDFSGAVSMLVALLDKLGLGSVDLRVLGDVIDMDSTFNLPDISLGVAELKNFAINLGLELPLQDGDGRLGIGVGSKASPLDIDVMMFGATFWLQIDLGFGGGGGAPSQTISMGVSVYWEMLDFDIIIVKVAFTLRLAADWKLSSDEVVFTGAVSLEGEVEVLGLVSVSASIVCSLTYSSATEQMVLLGTVNYCVDSFLGKVTSGSVPIGRTTIDLGDGQGPAAAAGARRLRSAAPARGGQSSFTDRYGTREWADYCDAFA